MSIIEPNYNNSADRELFDFLVKKSREKKLSELEDKFVRYMYHMEEHASGLDG